MDQEHNNPTFGKCPHCGGDVLCGRYGFYCSEKCGMRIGKVYGKSLTAVQLGRLLSGKETVFQQKGKKITVLPEIEESSYQGMCFFQWKVKHFPKSNKSS